MTWIQFTVTLDPGNLDTPYENNSFDGGTNASTFKHFLPGLIAWQLITLTVTILERMYESGNDKP